MALRNQPYIPLYVQDYLTDEKLNMCSLASQGVYMKLMCIMHKSDEYGTILLKQKDKQNKSTCLNFATKVAKLLPIQVQPLHDAITELVDEGVLQISGDKLVQKRMVRDNDISDKRANAGYKGGKTTQFAKAKKKAKSKANSEGENENENESEDVSKSKAIIFPFDSENFKKYWDYWKEYKKKEHKFTYKSEISEQAALKKLSELADGNEDTALKIIEQSIAQGWAGIFELKTDNKINKASIENDLKYFEDRKKSGAYQ